MQAALVSAAKGFARSMLCEAYLNVLLSSTHRRYSYRHSSTLGLGVSSQRTQLLCTFAAVAGGFC